MKFNLPKVLVVVGPTASGKTKLAVALARRFHGEIISADSRQVYRGMDVGTGKDLDDYGGKAKSAKRKAQNKSVLYHLIDVASPRGQFTVAEYQRRAYSAIEEILGRGKLPIICGGTGLYVDSVVYGLQFPQIRNSQSAIRKLRQQFGRLSLPQLLARLRHVDAETYRVIDRHNRRRVERALEIYYQTGRPKSLQMVKVMPPYQFLVLGVQLPKTVLHRRIKRRLDQRLRHGLIAEVQRLHREGVSWRQLDTFGLEYRWVSRHLRGQVDRPTMECRLCTDIVRYARRQLTWFRHHGHVRWVSSTPAALLAARKFVGRD